MATELVEKKRGEDLMWIAMASLEISGKKGGATKYVVKCFRNVIASDPEFRLLT